MFMPIFADLGYVQGDHDTGKCECNFDGGGGGGLVNFCLTCSS